MVSLAPSPSILQSVQRRTMRTLVVAQVLGAVGLAAGGTAGALLAQDLTGDTAAAGLPLALLVLGSGIGALVVTRIMNVAGRRAGLTTAHLCGAAGASLSVAAAGLRDWPLLLGGCTLLGCGNAAVMLARYAAADLAAGRRGRSISTVVTAAS
ncbi:MAG TPA: MFS transporter, partial [Jatrophihabitantaceae bacterium]|nr:MFS transporter [Jatrophihabitantaceae bacterium]